MAYRDIKISNRSENKDRLTPVFSDLIGENEGEGKIADFLRITNETLTFDVTDSNNNVLSSHKRDLERLVIKYESQVDSKSKWLTLMGLMERKILQLRCFHNPTIAFTIQESKSGDKIVKYIVLRAQFVDLYIGKKEIRLYFNKLEDYPIYNSLEQLKEDKEFYNAAIESVRTVMLETISSDSISIQYLETELRKLSKTENDTTTNVVREIDFDAKKKADDFRKRYLNSLSDEQKEEVELHKNNLRKYRGDEFRIERMKENERHKEKMKVLRIKKNKK